MYEWSLKSRQPDSPKIRPFCSHLLSYAYAEGVLAKNWRDYAIDSADKRTRFCVIERGQDQPTAVLYSISRNKTQKSGGKDYYCVFDGNKPVCRSEKFLEALNIFRSIGIAGQKKKNFKVCRD